MDVAAVLLTISGVAAFQATIGYLNGPTRGVAFLYAPAVVGLVVFVGLRAGLLAAVCASVAFVGVIAWRTGQEADAVAAIITLLAFSAVAYITALGVEKAQTVTRRDRASIGYLANVAPTKTGLHYWSPDATGDYGADCARGAMLAEDVLLSARADGHPIVLINTLQDMVKSGKWGGLEAGFASRLAQALTQDDADNFCRDGRIIQNQPMNGARAIGDQRPRPDELT